VELEVSVVVESFTYGEGAALDRVGIALRAATQMVDANGDGEVLVADSSGDPALARFLEREFPSVRRIDARGLGYDEAKLKCAYEARGRFVLYLDGDCIPEPGWLDHHLGALRAGAPATGGFTRYDGEFMGAVESVLDFGFLLPAASRPLGCYASNNSGFRREFLLETPPPEGPMRCRCFAHAQLLERRGTPVRMVPAARVRHERQPLLRERHRQGYDAVAACWTNPRLPESRFLRLGVLAAPVFYGRAVAYDWRRIRDGRRDLELAGWRAPAAAILAPILRLVDLAGMVRALAPGGRESRVGLTTPAP
jgi:Glycosyl transferase family 2